jgi:3-(3-hydroxy-phenyl)propionate hydroxylase
VLDRLADLPNASVRWQAPVTGLSQDATTGASSRRRASDGDEQHSGSWVIGCDGARSTVRRLLGVPFEGTTWPQRFVATNVFYDFHAHGYTRSVFLMDDVHGAVIAKITAENLWRVTYSEDLSLPEDVRSVTASRSSLPRSSPTDPLRAGAVRRLPAAPADR